VHRSRRRFSGQSETPRRRSAPRNKPSLNIALFLTGGEQNTLPKQMWSAMVLQATPILGVASTLLLVLMSVFLLAAEIVRCGAGRRRGTAAPAA
jgi:hypothetical protein